MLAEQRILAIIPARGGSKRLPRKNVLSLNGKPLIAWTIDAARQSQYIDAVVVSSDDSEIISIAQQWGGSAPFKRPSELAGDSAGTGEVVEHCLDYYCNRGEQFDLVMILQPTSPLRSVVDIDTACEHYLAAQACGLISVCKCEHSPLWANTLPENLSLANFISPEIQGLRSQDIATHYRLNGAIYLFNVELFRQKKGVFFAPQVVAHVMDQHSSVDIDNELDFKFAEWLMSEWQAD